MNGIFACTYVSYGFQWSCIVAFAFPVLTCPLLAQATGTAPIPQPKYEARLERHVLIPMRDGIELSTDLYFPVGAPERLPVIYVSTPYNKRNWREDRRLGPQTLGFVGQGFVVAVQDRRGMYESGGGPFDPADGAPMFSTMGLDGYDTIEWLASRPWSNGRVGTYGCSNVAIVQIQQSIEQPPSLAAMVPMSSTTWGTTGGTMSYGMALRGYSMLVSGVYYRPPKGLSREQYLHIADRFTQAPQPFLEAYPGRPDPRLEALYFKLPLIDLVAEQNPLSAGNWRRYVTRDIAESDADGKRLLRSKGPINAPALHINGWYDFSPGETMEQVNLIRELAVNDTARQNQFIVMGPRIHCSDHNVSEHTIVGERDVGDARFDYYGLYLRWFDHWLREAANGVTAMPRIQYYVMGKGEWRSAEEWPLRGTRFTPYYLHSDGRANSRLGTGVLAVEKPRDEPPDRYRYDPASPVPTRGGAQCCTKTSPYRGAFDQRDIELRHDVLVYTTPPLEEGLEVTGPLAAVLYVSSSARDTDFTAKLVDVYPDGRAYNLQDGIMRVRYREGYDREAWMKSGQVYEVKIEFEATSNYFAPGHRIRLEISSSNFPRYERNLNTGGRNYDEIEWVIAENAVHHSREHASYLLLPIVP